MLFSISRSVSDDRRTSTTLRKNQVIPKRFLCCLMTPAPMKWGSICKQKRKEIRIHSFNKHDTYPCYFKASTKLPNLKLSFDCMEYRRACVSPATSPASRYTEGYSLSLAAIPTTAIFSLFDSRFQQISAMHLPRKSHALLERLWYSSAR